MEEIIDNLIQAGFPADDIMIVDGAVYVGRDAHVTLEASREMLESGDESAEQYRTTNLVGISITKICINPTTSFNSVSMLSQALNAAIDNYNALGLRLAFARGPTNGCTANITATTTSGVGSSAGFPWGGKPYGLIYIGTGLQNYSLDVNEHVITHEIGHTIGIRHSDYYNRSISCGSGGSEGDTGIGAVYIPGTPTMATIGGSLMNSCFDLSVPGEFTLSDYTAFRHLYNKPQCGDGICNGTETSDSCWADCGCHECSVRSE
ncbi:MAG TPA: zinc-dependent metalloprotease [Kofleriaceae bacterium]|nr:zinc-dependent metalloprotease [Kofleriaceae bacterium]